MPGRLNFWSGLHKGHITVSEDSIVPFYPCSVLCFLPLSSPLIFFCVEKAKFGFGLYSCRIVVNKIIMFLSVVVLFSVSHPLSSSLTFSCCIREARIGSKRTVESPSALVLFSVFFFPCLPPPTFCFFCQESEIRIRVTFGSPGGSGVCGCRRDDLNV